MHRHLRLEDTARALFDCRQPITAETISGIISVRVAGVRHCLRLLHKRGLAERGRDGRQAAAVALEGVSSDESYASADGRPEGYVQSAVAPVWAWLRHVP